MNRDPSEGILKLLQEIDKLTEDSKKISGRSDEASQNQYQVNLSTQINKVSTNENIFFKKSHHLMANLNFVHSYASCRKHCGP